MANSHIRSRAAKTPIEKAYKDFFLHLNPEEILELRASYVRDGKSGLSKLFKDHRSRKSETVDRCSISLDAPENKDLLDTPLAREAVIAGISEGSLNPLHGHAPPLTLVEETSGSYSFNHVVSAEMQNAFENLLMKLKPREERIIRMRFGINTEPLTQREIADTLQTGKESIAQTENRILKKLKHSRFNNGLRRYLSPVN